MSATVPGVRDTAASEATVGSTDSRTATVIIDIGRLITNDLAHEAGPLGALPGAWLVMRSGRIEAIGTGPAPAADVRIDAAGRCVLPGFVDSHSHLVFAGDRAEEFEARMAGRRYEAGGINTTVTETRAASDAHLRTEMLARLHDAHGSGTTTIEIKSGYGLTPDDEARTLRLAREISDETTFLGAHVLPNEYGGRPDDYVALVCGAMLDACTPYARWIDAFCEVGAFDADQCRAVLSAGRAVGLGLKLHANQLGHGPGVLLAVEMGCASADHCTYLSDADIGALAGSATVATFLPIADFSTRQPYPDARRAIDAGVTVALAANCNPGSSYSTSMPLCIALAVRDMRMTVAEAVWAATAGGAAALRRTDIGALRPGARADVQLLDAPSATHFVYRPGMAIVAATFVGGVAVA